MFTSLTYNRKGFYTSVDYIRSEIDVSKPDIVFLQDTWHLSNASPNDEKSQDVLFVRAPPTSR